MHVDWDEIVASRAVPTVFINSDTGLGLLLRWEFLDENVGEPLPDTLLSDFEIPNAFQSVQSVVHDFFGRAPSGFRLMPGDLRYLQENDIRISGSSLGLALAVGAAAWVLGKPWPRRTLAWGAVLPVRNDGFSLYPVDDHEPKLTLARLVGARTVLISESQQGSHQAGINCLSIPTRMHAALQAVETLLQKEIP